MTKPWKPLPRLRVSALNLVPISAGLTFGPFVNSNYSLDWVIQGGGITWQGNTRIKTRAGTIMLNRPGETMRHNWTRTGNSFHSFFSFKFGKLPADWPVLHRWPNHRFFSPEAPIFSAWKSLLGSKAPSPALSNYSAEYVIRQYLTGSTQNPTPIVMPQFPAPVELALLYMGQRAARENSGKVGLSEVANAARVTPSHLCHLFKQHLQASPLNCFQAIRLERLAQMLERSNSNLGAIAERYGFATAFHLSTVFKRFFGISPAKYRKLFLAGTRTRPASLLLRNHPLRRYTYEPAPGRVEK
jgi:AraC-like DNA-binding protein